MAASATSTARGTSSRVPPERPFRVPPERPFIVATPCGPARVTFCRASRPIATLLLGHGAGGGIESQDLASLARDLPLRGITVGLVEQPWRVAGRRIAERPASLDVAWVAVVTEVGLLGKVVGPLIVGGRSAGARVAVRTADACGARAVLALAYPMHPPGRPSTSRAAELTGAAAQRPVLVVQGDRDSFGGPDDLRTQIPADLFRRPVGPVTKTGVTVQPVPWAGHSLEVGRRAPVTRAESWGATEQVIGWWLGAVVRGG